MKFQKKITWARFLEKFFYFFIFILPWQTVYILKNKYFNKEKFQFATVNIYFFEIILVLWLLFVLVYFLKESKPNLKKIKLLFFSKTNIFIFLFCLWLFLSISWSTDKTLAIFFSINILLSLALFLSIKTLMAKKIIHLKKTIIIFLFSANIQGLLGVWQFIKQETFSSKWLGISAFNIWQGGSPVLQGIDERWLRAYGGFQHPNIFAGYLLVALFFNLYIFVRYTSSNFFYKFTSVFSLVVLFSSFILTFSRSTLLTFFIGIISLPVFLNRNTSKKLLLPFLTLFFVGLLFIVTFSNIFLSRITVNSYLEKKSVNDRITYIIEAEKIISQHPFIGVGPGNYTLNIFNNSFNKKEVWQYQPVHNVFILILAELGLFGLFLYIGIILNIIWSFSSHLKLFSIKEKDSSTIFFSTTLLLLIVLFLFDHWLWSSAFGLILFWLVAGISSKNEKI